LCEAEVALLADKVGLPELTTAPTPTRALLANTMSEELSKSQLRKLATEWGIPAQEVTRVGNNLHFLSTKIIAQIIDSSE